MRLDIILLQIKSTNHKYVFVNKLPSQRKPNEKFYHAPINILSCTYPAQKHIYVKNILDTFIKCIFYKTL